MLVSTPYQATTDNCDCGYAFDDTLPNCVFVNILADIVQTRLLTRVQWRKIRRMMGKPRRCSPIFFAEERQLMEYRRSKVRKLQQQVHQGVVSYCLKTGEEGRLPLPFSLLPPPVPLSLFLSPILSQTPSLFNSASFLLLLECGACAVSL